MTGQRTEVQCAITVRFDGRQRHSEDTLLSPLEVKTGNIEVSSQRIGEEEAVAKSPGLVLLQRIDDQTVAEFIGEIGKGVVASLADINDSVGNEGVRVGVFRTESIAADSLVGAQVKDVHGVRADLLGGVADANGSSVEHPEASAFVGLDTVNGVQTVLAVTDGIAAPIWIRDEFGRSRNGHVGVDVGQRGWDSC